MHEIDRQIHRWKIYFIYATSLTKAEFYRTFRVKGTFRAKEKAEFYRTFRDKVKRKHSLSFYFVLTVKCFITGLTAGGLKGVIKPYCG